MNLMILSLVPDRLQVPLTISMMMTFMLNPSLRRQAWLMIQVYRTKARISLNVLQKAT